MTRPWMDLTLSATGDQTITREPDGTFELEFRDEERHQFISILLTEEAFHRLAEKVRLAHALEPTHAAEDR